MKKYVLIVCLVSFSALSLFAQTQFKGGKGDGYANDKFSLVITALNEKEAKKNPKVNIYPNPIPRGQYITVAVPPNTAEITGIRVIDDLGQFVWEQSIYDLKKSKSAFSLEIGGMHRAGSYILLLDFPSKTIIKKIIII